MLQCVCGRVCVGVFHVSTPIIPIQLCWDRCCLLKAPEHPGQCEARSEPASCSDERSKLQLGCWNTHKRVVIPSEPGGLWCGRAWKNTHPADVGPRWCYRSLLLSNLTCTLSIRWLVGWSVILWSESKHCFEHFKIKLEFRGNFRHVSFY